jgi:hypothetical protein
VALFFGAIKFIQPFSVKETLFAFGNDPRVSHVLHAHFGVTQQDFEIANLILTFDVKDSALFSEKLGNLFSHLVFSVIGRNAVDVLDVLGHGPG